MSADQSRTSPQSNASRRENANETSFDGTAVDESALAYRSIRNVFLERFPELWDQIEKKYSPHYNLKTQIPGTYPLFEEILKPRVTELLESGADSDSLKRIFSFYEEMASTHDDEVKNLLWKSMLEPLASDKKLIAEAWKYMGEKTKILAREIAALRGWQGNLPTEGRS
ncbi:MAG: hypothetical protein WCD49_18610 [Candidatus Acidiferrales bacterium]